ncbi:hypothetical protein ACFLSF_01120 [Candidatus Bipolaricaulota bacterium]
MCEEEPSDLRADMTGRASSDADLNNGLEDGDSREREPTKRPIEEEVQACTSSRVPKSFQLRPNRDVELLDKYGVEKVQAGVNYVLSQDNVRNRAGLLESYLANDGWKKLSELKEFLYHMPDPRTPAEQASIACQIVRLYDGDKYAALEAVDQVRKDQLGMESSAQSIERQEIASRIVGAAADARHFIVSHERTEEEKQLAEEISQCFPKLQPRNESLELSKRRDEAKIKLFWMELSKRRRDDLRPRLTEQQKALVASLEGSANSTPENQAITPDSLANSSRSYE